MKRTRREFLRTAAWASLALLGAPRARAAEQLVPGPENLLSLAPGFSYRVISRVGDEMSDGLLVPGAPDGTGAFPGPGGSVILVRNHELTSGQRARCAFGPAFERLAPATRAALYDAGSGDGPQLGGTTTLVYDPARGRVESSWLSLGGTVRNCAGGVTPWGSWLSCEEDVSRAGGEFARDHGYVFEVSATSRPALAPARALVGLGRMNHEAAAVEPRSGVVYLTEDRADGLLYRFLPDVPGDLSRGGKLQALRLRDGLEDTRNWNRRGAPRAPRFPKATPQRVDWVTLDRVESPDDDLRARGHALGAALFARGEGLWIAPSGVYVSCTFGGPETRGQIFRYSPSPREGRADEAAQPGTLELFLESDAATPLHNPDNLTVAPWGDLFVCEDSDAEPDGLVRVDARGRISTIARNLASESELSGCVFAPDSKTLFVNVQKAGVTLAITGPFREQA